MKTFYTESPLWHEKIGGIHVLLERVKISEERFREQNGDALHLRKLSRIMSIHASTAIEGNKLTLGQVTAIINGAKVYGPPKDVREVQNAWQAYNGLDSYDPWSVEDLLRAHSLMTSGLIGESGEFRSVDVAVVRSDGAIMHRGAAPASVPQLVAELFGWGRESLAHPLIKSSAVHFMLEHIHPFRDGNGRIGRLWQTLVLSKWNPLFAWMPIETLVHYNQALYYNALQESHSGEVDCRPFIDSMLDMIENSMYRYIDVATETVSAADDGINDGTNGGINVVNDGTNDGTDYYGINDGINDRINMVNEATNDGINYGGRNFGTNGGINDGINVVNDGTNDGINYDGTNYDGINDGINVVNAGINDGINYVGTNYGGTNGGINVGADDGISLRMLEVIRKFPAITAKQLAERLGCSRRTAERHIAGLKASGRLIRVGPNKNGHWEA
ncbi:MAG: Fic family protein [Clostridiales Family XIII bacterium]|jgi:Fic family protein|nr:Fic family protein [Clostridiales Family XIII bacterium]